MTTPIEIKLFIEEREVQPQGNIVMYNIFGLDDVGNRYDVHSYLQGNGDQWTTIAYKKIQTT